MISTGMSCQLALALLVVFITVFTPAPAYTLAPKYTTRRPCPKKNPPPPGCRSIPPIACYRRILSIKEESKLKSKIRHLEKRWVPYGRHERVDFDFVPHKNYQCTGKHCPRGKRATADEVQSRQTRSVPPCRKDYRQMTKKEMNTFHKALKELKDLGIYDQLVNFHNPDDSPGAHFGASFLPWHREYLYQLEQKIRELPGNEYDEVTVPFWDSCMDESLPDPRDCVVWWTKKFWGPGNGVVNNGKLARNWGVTSGCNPPNSRVFREVPGEEGELLTREKIANDILPSNTFTELALESPFEDYHGLKHVYVGGHMNWDFQCAPNDPVFFLLHSMIDCIWEEWIANGNTNEYPPDGHPLIGTPDHYRDADMKPFPGLQNVDGFWDGYSCCHQRPSLIQCTNDASCKSKQGLLFCHQCRCHCKVRKGGNCQGLPDNACYCPKKKQSPRCKGGKCRCK